MALKLGKWLPARVSLTFLCAVGVMELYMSRINLSIAIVTMVQTVTSGSEADIAPKDPYCLRGDVAIVSNESEPTNVTLWSEHQDVDEPKAIEERPAPPIKMTTTQRGNVLSAFFYSYWISGILGGRLAELYGTKLVFGVALFMDGLGNMLIPIASTTRTELLFFIRFTMGFFQGLCYPSLSALTATWIPPDETSRFMAFVLPANCIGTIFTLSVCGLIISELGWEWVFYICGSISFFWFIVWSLFMYDSPENHPRISATEKRYIREAKEAANRSSKTKAKKTPWKEMVLSKPLWAIVAAHSANMFGNGLFFTQLPIYLSSIIGVNIKNNGLLSSLPFLARFVGSNTFSWLSNFLMKRTSLHGKTWKIILTIIGLGGPGVSVVLVGYAGCDATAVLCFFIMGLALSGGNASGYLTNIVEIAPSFSGTAFGMCSTVGFLYAMIVPVITGALTPEETLSEWVTVYWIVFTNFLIGTLLYSTLVSTDAQPWNNVHGADEAEVKSKK